MADIGLISCVSMKQKIATEARNLYVSPLFVNSKKYSIERLDKYYILSAKYGLVHPDTRIEPYEETLNKKSKEERISWAQKVFSQIKNEITRENHLVFLAGEKYKDLLNSLLIEDGYLTRSPLNKLSIGRQLQWYKSYNDNQNRLKDLDELYSIINKLRTGLGTITKLAEIDGASLLPQKGVYLFSEDNEYRTTAPFEPRITRVGTHAVSEGSSSTLWNRLRTHRGSNDLRGNHRGSIFRLHVGNSLINKYQLDYPSWGIGQNAEGRVKKSEIDLERKVSEYIGNMYILWLTIPDKSSKTSDRAYIEKNVIALLSSYDYKLDLSSDSWLGSVNDNKFIRESMLWNINYVDLKYDPRVLEILDFYVDVTLGKKSPPNKSIVPLDWHQSYKNDPQLKLFK